MFKIFIQKIYENTKPKNNINTWTYYLNLKIAQNFHNKNIIFTLKLSNSNVRKDPIHSTRYPTSDNT